MNKKGLLLSLIYTIYLAFLLATIFFTKDASVIYIAIVIFSIFTCISLWILNSNQKLGIKLFKIKSTLEFIASIILAFLLVIVIHAFQSCIASFGNALSNNPTQEVNVNPFPAILLGMAIIVVCFVYYLSFMRFMKKMETGANLKATGYIYLGFKIVLTIILLVLLIGLFVSSDPYILRILSIPSQEIGVKIIVSAGILSYSTYLGFGIYYIFKKING